MSMADITVKNFWMEPTNPNIGELTELSFGYESNGKSYSYDIIADPTIADSMKKLHEVFWILRDCMKKSILPWNKFPADTRQKLIIANSDDPQTSFLTNLLAKTASRLDNLNILRKIM